MVRENSHNTCTKYFAPLFFSICYHFNLNRGSYFSVLEEFPFRFLSYYELHVNVKSIFSSYMKYFQPLSGIMLLFLNDNKTQQPAMQLNAIIFFFFHLYATWGILQKIPLNFSVTSWKVKISPHKSWLCMQFICCWETMYLTEKKMLSVYLVHLMFWEFYQHF